jgi:hypothetical protein
MVVRNDQMTTLVGRKSRYEGACRQGLSQGDCTTRDAHGCTTTNQRPLESAGGAVAYPQGVEVASAGCHQASGRRHCRIRLR